MDNLVKIILVVLVAFMLLNYSCPSITKENFDAKCKKVEKFTDVCSSLKDKYEDEGCEEYDDEENGYDSLQECLEDNPKEQQWCKDCNKINKDWEQKCEEKKVKKVVKNNYFSNVVSSLSKKCQKEVKSDKLGTKCKKKLIDKFNNLDRKKECFLPYSDNLLTPPYKCMLSLIPKMSNESCQNEIISKSSKSSNNISITKKCEKELRDTFIKQECSTETIHKIFNPASYPIDEFKDCFISVVSKKCKNQEDPLLPDKKCQMSVYKELKKYLDPKRNCTSQATLDIMTGKGTKLGNTCFHSILGADCYGVAPKSEKGKECMSNVIKKLKKNLDPKRNCTSQATLDIIEGKGTKLGNTCLHSILGADCYGVAPKSEKEEECRSNVLKKLRKNLNSDTECDAADRGGAISRLCLLSLKPEKECTSDAINNILPGKQLSGKQNIQATKCLLTLAEPGCIGKNLTKKKKKICFKKLTSKVREFLDPKKACTSDAINNILSTTDKTKNSSLMCSFLLFDPECIGEDPATKKGKKCQKKMLKKALEYLDQKKECTSDAINNILSTNADERKKGNKCFLLLAGPECIGENPTTKKGKECQKKVSKKVLKLQKSFKK